MDAHFVPLLSHGRLSRSKLYKYCSEPITFILITQHFCWHYQNSLLHAIVYAANLCHFRGAFGTFLTVLTVLWCSFSASKLFVSALQMEGQQLLVGQQLSIILLKCRQLHIFVTVKYYITPLKIAIVLILAWAQKLYTAVLLQLFNL